VEGKAMTIQITRPEIEKLIKERLQSGKFSDAEDVILQALQSSGPERPCAEGERREAIERLRTFGKTHGILRGGNDNQEIAR
jgi:hypothetical protein